MLVINRTVELKSALEWIKSSFSTLREKPLQFIVLGIFSTLISLMPAFGAFMAPIFVAKYARLTAQIENNEEVLFSSIFDDLFSNKTVVRLAFVNFCINSLILFGQYFVEGYFKEHGMDVTTPGFAGMVLLFIPVLLLQASMWLSPLICLYNEEVSPFQAMWLSLKASGLNIALLLLYTLFVIFFTILAILPLGLGLLVWLPMLNIVTYFIYKSLFIQDIRRVV